MICRARCWGTRKSFSTRQTVEAGGCHGPRGGKDFIKSLKPSWLGGHGGLLLYYTLGSDPALWPAGERRERGLLAHDKGYYHSYVEKALIPNNPTLIPKTSTPTLETPPGSR